MRSPSKNPISIDAPAAAPAAPAASPTDREAPLTAADFEFLSTLDPRVAGDEHVRSDMLQLLTESETVDAITKHAPLLTALGLDPAPALAATVRIRQLQRTRRRLDLAQALVTRHLQSTGAPSMEIVSKLHRLLEGTPEHSALRVAFSLFLEQWQGTFRGGGRPAKSQEARAEKSDEAAAKTPPTK